MTQPFADFEEIIEHNVDLFPYTTLKLPAVAEYLFVCGARQDDSEVLLREVIAKAYSASVPTCIIGGGSNIASVSSKIPGLVIVNRLSQKEVIREQDDFVDLQVSAGYSINRLVNETCQAGLSGFEYQLGLPGTVGGAIYMNSKWMRPVSYVSDTLLSARILDSAGEVRTVDRDYFAFSYGYSKLQDTREILLNAVFRLTRGNARMLQDRAQEALEYRKKSQPIGVATAGCFFHNISEDERLAHQLPTTSAGYLIDQSGFKGVELGHFAVSSVHANFLIHKGGGDARELRTVLKRIKDAVFSKFGVVLHEEVRLIPNDAHRTID